MERIKDTVMSVFGELAQKQPATADADPREWLKKVLTKTELKHIKFNYFNKGILGVNVDSSAWLYSLSMKKEFILREVSRLSKEVKEVRLRIGEIK